MNPMVSLDAKTITPIRLANPFSHPLSLLADLWHLNFQRFIVWLYFDRVTVHGAENIPRNGSALLIGLHRNGAVDGFVYHTVAPRAVFMVTARLLKKLLVRLFMSGIEIMREKDRAGTEVPASANAQSLQQCQDLLKDGGCLCIFPEGTSSLGSRHLPFKSGAARLALDYISSEAEHPLSIVPMGIHYEAPSEFRSRLNVVVGERVSVRFPQEWNRAQQLNELKRRFEAALLKVGVNVESDEQQDTVQRLAYIATLGTSRSYFHALKHLESGIPEEVLSSWKSLSLEFGRPGLLTHQGVPLFPVFPMPLMIAALALLGPLTMAGWMVNAPPLLAAAWAGRTFPDERNVVSLWRILVGVPVFMIWSVLILLICALTGHLSFAAIYLILTFAALKLTRRTRNVAIEINNGLRHSDLKARAMGFHKLLLDSLPDETF